MKRTALVLALLAATTACDGATPTGLSPSFNEGSLGSGGGRSEDGGYIGSGVGAQSADDGGHVGSGVGARSADDGGHIGSGVGASLTSDGGWLGSGGGGTGGDTGAVGSGCCPTTLSVEDGGVLGSGGGRTGLIGPSGG
jgi:hypothetical protein